MKKLRRVIWLSDEQWAELKRRAELRELSVSAYIGASIGVVFVPERAAPKPSPYTAVRPVPKPGKGK